MYNLRKRIGKFIDVLSSIGMAVTFILMFITAIDTILRKTSSMAIIGSLEITEVGMVILIFFGIASNQISKGHVSVDMFVERFSRKMRLISDTVVLTIEAVVMGIMAYCGYLLTVSYIEKGLETSVLGIPMWPFSVLMTIGLFLFTIVLLIDAIISATSVSKRNFQDDIESAHIDPAD